MFAEAKHMKLMRRANAALTPRPEVLKNIGSEVGECIGQGWNFGEGTALAGQRFFHQIFGRCYVHLKA